MVRNLAGIAAVLSGGVMALVGAFALSACSNIKGNLDISALVSPSPTVVTPTLVISSVVRDSTDPTGTFDILGDNTGWMATYCTATDGSGSTTGASTCQCVYTFSTPEPSPAPSVWTATTTTINADTTYHEANLIKCTHDSSIPTDVQTINVSIVVNTVPTTGGPYPAPPIYSNTLPFNFYTSGGVIDTTNISNYSLVKRYTCKDVVTVPNVFEPGSGSSTFDGIYDPMQSENPAISYPLNFYTTNMGDTMNRYVLQGPQGGGWDCPINPDNPGSDYNVTIYSSSAWPSGSSSPSPSYVIDQPGVTTTQPRSTFYLSKNSTGVFTVPLDAYIAPYLVTAPTATPSATPSATPTSTSENDATTPPPLGYGASPTSLGTAGQETCPDSTIPIPANYHWVKVWLYRMSLPTRHYLTSSKFQTLNAIACSPGLWGSGGYGFPYKYVFPDCADQDWADFHLDYMSTHTVNALAARIFSGTLMCMHPWAGVINQADSAASSWPGWSDEWDRNSDVAAFGSPSQQYSDQTYSCFQAGTATATTGRNDPVNLCTQTNNTATPATAPDDTSPVPYDSSPTSENIDNPSTPRYDYVFVVTPTTVMSGDMTDTTSQATFLYAPYRYRVDTDCGVANPNSPPAGLCQAQDAFTNYGIVWNDVNNISSNNTSSGSTSIIFPICALQPNY